MYESPILITQIVEQIGTELVEQEEAYVFSAVKRMNVDVNKDELVRALAYDRGQYDKGYSDGRAARDAEIVLCKDCVYAIHYNEKWTLPEKSNCLWCKLYEDIRTPGWFCADGERRDNE